MKVDLSKFFAAVDAEKERQAQQEISDDFHDESDDDADFPLQDFPDESAREQPDDLADAPVTIAQPEELDIILQPSDAGEPDKIRAQYLADLKPFIKADLSALPFMRLEYLRARIITGNQNAKILAAAFDKEAARTDSMTAWTALFS